ncbi:hypothetical protein ASG90_12525 [Nocardioides sp. Soil797]|nr:hypothetical protein ASG90_12525 [Nocardioides sp. Soil797]
MRSTDRLVMLLLLLACIMIAGMLTTSWRVVLYPYLVVIGVIILLGVGTRRSRDSVLMWMGIGVPLGYLAFYLWLEVAMQGDGGASTNLVAGVVPTTAIYFFAIWPFGLVVGGLYALFHNRIMSDDVIDEPHNRSVARGDQALGDRA